MFTKIKEFLFGKPAETEAPYKVEAPAPKIEVVPAGTEASVAAVPVAEKPKAPAKPATAKAPAKPATAKAPANPKAPPKPKAPRKPAAK